MGVYVKGMKFPDSCCVCPIMNQDDGYCEVNHDRADDIWNRPEWCPLVEVPTPHGRMIDADALIDLWHGCEVSGDIKPIIDVRPTVIEAEDE